MLASTGAWKLKGPETTWSVRSNGPRTNAGSGRGWISTSNGGAQRLYEQFGFRSAGVRPRYYADNGEDAVIMWRTAPPG